MMTIDRQIMTQGRSVHYNVIFDVSVWCQILTIMIAVVMTMLFINYVYICYLLLILI